MTAIAAPVGLPKVSDAITAELEDWGPLKEATGAKMSTAGLTLWSDDASDDESGIWECTPGPSYWSLETNEFVHIVAGRMTVTEDGGEPVEVGLGDTVLFATGWKGTWEIHETVRKLYVIF
jgi:uncharacterized cupin superfamily protein